MKNQKKAIPACFLLAAVLLFAVACGAEGQKPSETAEASLPAEERITITRI